MPAADYADDWPLTLHAFLIDSMFHHRLDRIPLQLLLVVALVPGIPSPIWAQALTARLKLLEDRYPVNSFTNSSGNTFRFGPTDLISLPHRTDKVIVTTHSGVAFVADSNGQLLPTPLLDLSHPNSPSYNPNFRATPIQGLTTLAFHPNFADPTHAGFGRFYTVEPERTGSGPIDFGDSIKFANHHEEVVYEYTISDVDRLLCDDACVASKRPLMRLDQPGLHHNVGDLLFDETGLLFISSGDGDNAREIDGVAISDNSQRLTNVYGKILRIDPLGNNSANGRYGIPSTNPFVDGPGSNVDEIYAYGLRNPYRMASDPETGELYVSETGQLLMESIDRVVSGGNYGWNLKEGTLLFDKADHTTVVHDLDLNGNGIGDVAEQNGLIEPIVEFGRDVGQAIIGLALYRGSQFPELHGKLLFADHFGRLFYGDPQTGDVFPIELDTNSAAIPELVFSVNSGPDGEPYVLGISSNTPDSRGVLLQLQRSHPLGDFDLDGELDVDDINLLTAAALSGDEARFDLTGDGIVDQLDRRFWVKDLRRTSFGDATLDGVFGSDDLVAVFRSGEYEDEIAQNSTWSTGDWDGDLDFTTGDMVFVLQEGSFEQGVDIDVVPEPHALAPLCLFFLSVTLGRRRGAQRLF